MHKRITLFLLIAFAIPACDENDNFVIFSIQDDVQLGQQVDQEIENDPNFKILDPDDYPEAYQYLYDMRDGILNSGEVAYVNEFKWELHIIDNDSVLNAFATPGGYIYVYTGLMKYLNNADALAGVMGHEMAHADLRHSVRNLQKQYGVSILLSVVLGEDPSTLEQIAAQLAGTLSGLKFSREFEQEADLQSVEYLSHLKYACDGAARFFIQMEAEGNSQQPPEFLSTHPSHESRIEDINEKVYEINCDATLAEDTEYESFLNSLPE